MQASTHVITRIHRVQEVIANLVGRHGRWYIIIELIKGTIFYNWTLMHRTDIDWQFQLSATDTPYNT